MTKSNLPKLPSYAAKPPSKLTVKDVEKLIDDYKDWLYRHPENVTFASFCREKGIKYPYRLKNYLMQNFTGSQTAIDFKSLWAEVEKIREDKLIELGIFNKDVNSNFLLGLMKSRFGWHDNTVVVGISMDDIVEAKQRALKNARKAIDAEEET